jgi:hypothetical protein
LANDEFSKFGSYSNSTHNQNKRNTGYNNSLNEGFNFSTTLGANFSTVVGGNFSTTGGVTMSAVGGFNLPVTLGGKIELISPWSIKSTRGFLGAADPLPISAENPAPAEVPDGDLGGYDYDFKNCRTQVKLNEGQVYNYSKLKAVEYVADGLTVVLKTEDKHIKQGSMYCESHTLTTNTEVKNVDDGTLNYKTLETTVDGDCSISGGNEASDIALTKAGINVNTTKTLTLTGSEAFQVTSNGTATINGKTIKVG